MHMLPLQAAHSTAWIMGDTRASTYPVRAAAAAQASLRTAAPTSSVSHFFPQGAAEVSPAGSTSTSSWRARLAARLRAR